MKRPDLMGVEREHVCLVESQRARKDGTIPSACCSTNTALLTAGTPAQYSAAFPRPGCADNWSPAGPGGMNISPQIYGVAGFRAARDTGDMDMDNGFDRQKGLTVVQTPGPFALEFPRFCGVLSTCDASVAGRMDTDAEDEAAVPRSVPPGGGGVGAFGPVDP